MLNLPQENMGMSHSANRTISGSSTIEKTPSDNTVHSLNKDGQVGRAKDKRCTDGQSSECRSKERRNKGGRAKDASVAREWDCKKKCPTKTENIHKGFAKKNPDVFKEPPEVAQKRKRWEQRASYALTDTLSQKERKKLLSRDSVLPLNRSSFTNAMLRIHNSYRADHGVPPLRLSKELNKLAQSRAEALVNFCSRTSKDTTKGIPEIPPTVGENVFVSNSDNRVVASAALVCSEWYASANNFDYNCHGKIGKKTIVFMNMIWKTSQEMGAGRAVSGIGKVVTVALYFPKPAIPNEIRDNVFPPSGSNTNLASNQPKKTPSKPSVNKGSLEK